jgi:hypothetical protein
MLVSLVRIGVYRLPTRGAPLLCDPRLLSGKPSACWWNLQGHYELSTSFFDGEIHLEKSFMPRAIAFSGFLDLTYFVVSTKHDSKPSKRIILTKREFMGYEGSNNDQSNTNNPVQ